LSAQLQQLEEQKDKVEQKAKDKARKIVDDARREAEGIIAELRTMQKNAQHVIKDHELIDVRKRLEKAAPENTVLKKQQQIKARQMTLTKGDEVKVLSYGQKGILLDKVSNTEWSVQIGILKMKVAESDLEYLKPEKQKQTVAMSHVKGRDTYVKLDLDLRGERFEDAILRAEKYIDDAILSSYQQVSIIHGKGTGALRQGIQQFLKNHSRVKSYRFGEAGEGGHGVTIVELK
jgi:DNA mismatch repair protein MutS2